MSIERELIDTELTEESTIEGSEEGTVTEMSTLTAIMWAAQAGQKGKDLMAKATDEIIMDMLSTYSKIRIIH